MRNFNADLFNKGFIFTYKWNNHIVLNATALWVYVIDIDYDPEFSSEDNQVFFISYWTLEEDLIDNDLFFNID